MTTDQQAAWRVCNKDGAECKMYHRGTHRILGLVALTTAPWWLRIFGVGDQWRGLAKSPWIDDVRVGPFLTAPETKRALDAAMEDLP